MTKCERLLFMPSSPFSDPMGLPWKALLHGSGIWRRERGHFGFRSSSLPCSVNFEIGIDDGEVPLLFGAYEAHLEVHGCTKITFPVCVNME